MNPRPAKGLLSALATLLVAVGLGIGIFPQTQAQADSRPVAGTAETVSGKATVTPGSAAQGQALKQGSQIREGDTIETGAGGYVYVITQDQGFISLRPNSRLTIDRYRFDPKNPSAAEIRWTLHNGVARVVSGRGIEAAKNRFRMNTPIAAIGVRGTDFSVFSDSKITRASVLSGAIVVSPFNDQCSVSGLGPCAGSSGLELIAGQAAAAQLRAGDVKPEMLKLPELSPDRVAPPRKDEVPPTGKSASDVAPLQAGSATTKSVAAELVSDKRSFASAPAVHWGRWAAFAGQPANALENLFGGGKEIFGFVGPYGMSRDSVSERAWPSSGKFSFVLWNYEAYVMNSDNTRFTPAAIQNGSFTVDFGNNRYATSFELFAGALRTNVSSEGVVSRQGQLYSDPQQTTILRGVIAGARGDQAGYMFSQPLTGTQDSAVGVTRWIR